MNRPELIREQSREAFRILRFGRHTQEATGKPLLSFTEQLNEWDVQEAIKTISNGIRGVGPATASGNEPFWPLAIVYGIFSLSANIMCLQPCSRSMISAFPT